MVQNVRQTLVGYFDGHRTPTFWGSLEKCAEPPLRPAHRIAQEKSARLCKSVRRSGEVGRYAVGKVLAQAAHCGIQGRRAVVCTTLHKHRRVACATVCAQHTLGVVRNGFYGV
ncbi:MAG: hypothetical protein QXS68_02940 [Candidatus Methanomethylicaceae archaeon]